jgi:hypothetical protein
MEEFFRYTDSDYPFGIFKPFFDILNKMPAFTYNY